jgi:hypothetical protein
LFFSKKKVFSSPLHILSGGTMIPKIYLFLAITFTSQTNIWAASMALEPSRIDAIELVDESGHRELPNLKGDLNFEVVDKVIKNLPKYNLESLLEISEHYDSFERVLLREQTKRLRVEMRGRFKSNKSYVAWFLSYDMTNLAAAWSAAWSTVRPFVLSTVRHAARHDAWTATRDAARDAAYSAARDAAGFAAWSAVRGAAWYAAWDAAWDAARFELTTDLTPETRAYLIYHVSALTILHWTLSDDAARIRNRAFEAALVKIPDEGDIAETKAIIARYTWEKPCFLGVDGVPDSITNPYIEALKEIFGER